MDESIAKAESRESSELLNLPAPCRSALWLLLFCGLYFAASALYFTGYTLSMTVRNLDRVGNPEFQPMVQESVMQHAESAAGMSGMFVVQFIVLLPFIFWASHFKTQTFKETLGFRKFPLKSLGLWLLFLGGFLVLQVLVDTLLKVESGDFLEALSGSKNVMLLFVFLAGAPFLEEMIFRGYLFKAWRRTRLGLTGTLLVTSGLFVLLHWGQYGLIQFIFLFALSMLLGLARERSGSLWVPIILHSTNNWLPAIAVIYLGLA